VSAVDVAALLERVVTDPATRGQVLEIGGPQNLSLGEIAAAIQAKSCANRSPRYVPRLMLRTMATVLRPLNAELARQAQAALVMDCTEMTFDPTPLRGAYPGLPTTTLRDVLARRAPYQSSSSACDKS